MRVWIQWIYVAYQLYTWVRSAIKEHQKVAPEYGDASLGFINAIKEVKATGRLAVIDDYVDKRGLRLGVERRRCKRHGLRRKRGGS